MERAGAFMQLFGPPRLCAASVITEFLPERRFQLLVLLALRSGEWFAREKLAALLWPGRSAAEGRRNLRHALHMARSVTGAENVEANEHALRWVVATDVRSFEEAIHGSRWTEAASLRRGPLAAAIEAGGSAAFSQWIGSERTRFEALWQRAAHANLRALTDPSQRMAQAAALLQVDPFDEEAMAALLAAELKLGHRARAQRLYAEYAARLAEELAIEPPRSLRDLFASNGSRESAPGASGERFVGRRTELALLLQWLRDPQHRLVSIVGPGGVGKSALARQVLSAAKAYFPSGAVWVDLQDVDVTRLGLARLADRFGVELGGADDPVLAIANRLPAERALAVLDNAEHLPELPAIVNRLLEAAPSLTAMLTSRLQTDLPGEGRLALEGLAVPDEESRDIAAAASFDAVRLFELRAKAAQRDFDLGSQLAAVIDIVDAVGGLPLAIELAAAWVRLLPPEQIARDLRSAIDILERDPAGTTQAPARPEHVSMRAVLERAWELLAPSERNAMVDLSAFHGGFSHAAARVVADVSLPVLSSLVDKSVLKVDAAGRFDMHPLLASDAAARAGRDHARQLAVASRQAEYFAHYLASRSEEQSAARAIVAAVEAEHANCRAAWRYAIACGRHDLLTAMLPAWRRYFDATGRFADSVRHFESALMPGTPNSAAARIRATLAHFLVRDRKPERALPLAEDSLREAETAGDAALAQDCAATIAASMLILGRWDEARRWLERSLAAAQERGDRRGIASELGNLGLIATFLGEFDLARSHYEQAVAIQTELDNAASAARAMCNLGFVDVARGDWARARAQLEKALRFSRDRGITAVALEAEFLLGSTLVELGLLEDAEPHLRHAGEGFQATRNAGFAMKVDCYLARIVARRGAPDDAGRVLLAAVRTARERGWTYDVLYAAIFVAEVLGQRGHAGEAALILRAVRTAPRAHAFVGTLVDAGLRVLPTERGENVGLDSPRPAFDAIADELVACNSLEQVVARLQSIAG